MTRQEAIKRLSTILHGDRFGWNPNTVEAFQMAIDALANTNVGSKDGNLIYRQAAKLKVARVIWEDGDSCYDFHDKCVDCLDDVPSAQPDHSDEAKFWKKRAESYEKTCFDLINDINKGMKISSIEINENGIIFTKEQKRPCDGCKHDGGTASAQPDVPKDTNVPISDCIFRQAAIDAAIDAVDEWDGGYNLTRADMIADAINNAMPSVQPDIIRCRDCRFWQDQEEGVVEVPICARPENRHEKYPFRFIVGADGYCSFAERKENA